MATFTWVSKKGNRDRFGRTATGIKATRFGSIDTSVVNDAAIATGLPKIGDRFHTSAYPLLAVRSIDIEPLFGGQGLGQGIAPSSANPGVSEVTINYDTAGGGSIKNPIPTEPGEAWTSIDVGSSSQTIYYGQDLADTANANTLLKNISAADLVGPLNDGDGVSIDVPTLSVTVVKAYAATDTIPFSTMVQMAGTLNSGPIALPPLYKTDARWNLIKGQSLFVGPKVEAQGELIVVSLQFVVAPDHHQRIQERAPDGKVAKRLTVRVRDYADHAVLV